MSEQVRPLPVSLSFNLQDVKAMQPLWFYAAVLNFVIMAVCMLAGLFDERTLNGVSVWNKPMKFGLSIGVYFITLAWFSQFLRPGSLASRSGKALVWIPLIAGIGEIAYILLMAALGQASHYNFSSALTTTMYSVMGVGAASMVLILPWMAFLIARQNPLSNPLILAIVVGLVMTCVLGGGYGSYLSSHDGHWVSAARTDENGLWLFNWARDGGDLRVAHFFGMHAMHAFPLVALLLPRNWSTHTQLAILVAVMSAYTAFSAMTFMQAIAGQPFMA